MKIVHIYPIAKQRANVKFEWQRELEFKIIEEHDDRRDLGKYSFELGTIPYMTRESKYYIIKLVEDIASSRSCALLNIKHDHHVIRYLAWYIIDNEEDTKYFVHKELVWDKPIRQNPDGEMENE